MKTTRQTLLAFAAFALAGLTGCDKPAASSGSESASPQAADQTGTPQTGDEAKRLSIFCWSEYVPQKVIDLFQKETGIRVSVENYASNEEMLAKLLAGGGQYDLIQPSEYVIEALIKENLLHPINKEAIPNLKNVDLTFLNMPFDPENKYSIPWMAGTVGIVVNTELVTDEITGYKDVFQDKHKNNIVVLDDAREIVSWGLASVGLPINDVDEASLEKIKPLISQWLPLVKVYDSDSPKTALLNGDVALGVVWSGEGAILLNEDKKFKWVVPEEGSHLFIDSLAIPKGARHVGNAELFMNFVLRPDVSKMISDEFPYLNPNLEARKLLTPEQLENEASFPTEEEIAKMQIFRDIGERASAVDEFITTIKVQ